MCDNNHRTCRWVACLMYDVHEARFRDRSEGGGQHSDMNGQRGKLRAAALFAVI